PPTPPPPTHTLSLHDALPISEEQAEFGVAVPVLVSVRAAVEELVPLDAGFFPTAQLHQVPANRQSDLRLIRIDGQTFPPVVDRLDRKSTRLNSSHVAISYAVF